MAWFNVAIGVGSAIYGGYQSKKQGDAAKKAMKDPLAKDRRGYADKLQTMQDDPASFYQNPLYQNAFGQGTQATMRGMAAEGFTGSGNFATGLQKFGQSFGMDMFMEYSKYLAEIAGFAHFPDQGAGIQGTKYAGDTMNDAFGQLGGVLGRFGGGGPAGTPTTTPGGSIYDVGGGYGNSPFGTGSWDVINAEGP